MAKVKSYKPKEGAVEDVRLYMVQCIEALRWLKTHQLAIFGLTVGAQTFLLTSNVSVTHLGRILFSIGIALVSIVVQWLSYLDALKTRNRENRAFEVLSSELKGVRWGRDAQSRNENKEGFKANWNHDTVLSFHGADVWFLVAYVLSPVLMVVLTIFAYKAAPECCLNPSGP